LPHQAGQNHPLRPHTRYQLQILGALPLPVPDRPNSRAVVCIVTSRIPRPFGPRHLPITRAGRRHLSIRMPLAEQTSANSSTERKSIVRQPQRDRKPPPVGDCDRSPRRLWIDSRVKVRAAEVGAALRCSAGTSSTLRDPRALATFQAPSWTARGRSAPFTPNCSTRIGS
jgi:hypothetical protein